MTTSEESLSYRIRRRNYGPAAVLLIGIWSVLAIVAGASMTAWHSTPLPLPSGTRSAANSPTGQWQMIHYLFSDCDCSRAVARYLISRGPRPETTERVLLIAGEQRRAEVEMNALLKASGFAVQPVAAQEAALRDGIYGVPFFEVIRPDGSVAVRSGYRERGASPNRFLDVQTVKDLKAGRDVPQLPVFGCAISERLRKQLDPFGLKRAIQWGRNK